jgi:hypothetical protein
MIGAWAAGLCGARLPMPVHGQGRPQGSGAPGRFRLPGVGIAGVMTTEPGRQPIDPAVPDPDTAPDPQPADPPRPDIPDDPDVDPTADPDREA